MKLALRLGTHGENRLRVPIDLIQRAEAVGFHSVWSAETYGADAFTPLVAAALNTKHIALATGVAQIPARPPATLAMQALSLDQIAGGGRVIVGVGLSGPRITEGWYGQTWEKPAGRLRDYVTILRKILDRTEAASHDGQAISLPYRGAGSTGQGRALKTILHPAARVPVWVGCDGPRSVEICAELADGWLPNGIGPAGTAPYEEALSRGFSRRSPAGPPSDFEIFRYLSVTVTNDVAEHMAASRRSAAFYVGGMGTDEDNFHRDAMSRRGFPEDAQRVHALWKEGKKEAAADAIPDEYIEQTSLFGSPKRIARLWNQTKWPGVTGISIILTQLEAVDLVADLAGGSAVDI